MWYAPVGNKSASAVILVPPFAEEMNKSRHMFTLLGDALAASGFNVLLPDLYGTGDSEGDFGEATWGGWLDNLARCVVYMQENGIERFSFVALRAGALLAVDYLQHYELNLQKLVLWHPVIDGGSYLNQFLRLRLAASMVRGSEGKETAKGLKEEFAAGRAVEVAGYSLSPLLAGALEGVSLKHAEVARLPDVCWIDLMQSEGQSPSLAHQKLVEYWCGAGLSMEYTRVVGDSFWCSVEIAEAPALIQKTVDCFREV